MVRSLFGIHPQSKTMMVEYRNKETLHGVNGFDTATISFYIENIGVQQIDVAILPSGYSGRRGFIDVLERHIADFTPKGFNVSVDGNLYNATFDWCEVYDESKIETLLIRSSLSPDHGCLKFIPSEAHETPSVLIKGLPYTFHRNTHLMDCYNVDNSKEESIKEVFLTVRNGFM